MNGLSVEEVRENIRVVPCGGGIQIEFHCCGVDFEAVVSKDGRLLEAACLRTEDQ